MGNGTSNVSWENAIKCDCLIFLWDHGVQVIKSEEVKLFCFMNLDDYNGLVDAIKHFQNGIRGTGGNHNLCDRNDYWKNLHKVFDILVESLYIFRQQGWEKYVFKFWRKKNYVMILHQL